jgi:hypothetical protein
MGWAKIKGSLPSRIGQRVRFGSPKDIQKAGGSHIFGRIVDEVWADPTINISPSRPSTGVDDWGDYSFFAQRIKWDNGSYSIRFGYYRRRAGEDCWEFSGQMTLSAHWSVVKAILDAIAAKPGWFRE